MFFFFQAEDGIRDVAVTGVQTCALPISPPCGPGSPRLRGATRAARDDGGAHTRALLLGQRGWGEKRAGRPPRGCSSRPGKPAKQNRLRHLLTTCRGVSRREAMVSLERPWAAIRTILARITSRYGDVYLRTLDFNSCRSSFVRTTVKGLCLGIEATSAETIVTQKYVIVFMKTSTKRLQPQQDAASLLTRRDRAQTRPVW